MRLRDANAAHESGDIIGEKLGRVGAFGFVAFTRAPQIQRNAGEVAGILSNLKGVTGMIGGKEGNQDERVARSLLLVVYGDVVRFDLGHTHLLKADRATNGCWQSTPFSEAHESAPRCGLDDGRHVRRRSRGDQPPASAV